MEKRMDRWEDGRMKNGYKKRMDGRRDGWMEEGMNGWKKG